MQQASQDETDCNTSTSSISPCPKLVGLTVLSIDTRANIHNLLVNLLRLATSVRAVLRTKRLFHSQKT